MCPSLKIQKRADIGVALESPLGRARAFLGKGGGGMDLGLQAHAGIQEFRKEAEILLPR